MSDVVLSTTESVTTVTVVDDVVQVAVTTNPVEVGTSTAGVQGASYSKGDPIYELVRNSTGTTLLKGQIVYLSGATGNHVNVSLAQASGDNTSARTIGWVSEDILNNANGFVMMFGYLEGIDTSAANAVGDILYLSPTVAGGWTSTKPSAPQHLVYVGVCVRKNPSNGAVSVHIQNGYELGELHDVAISNPVNAQVLTYDSATDLWVNATNPADGVTSITAVSPLTGGTITSTGSIGLDQTALSITKSQVSDFTSGTVTSASTAQQAGTAVYSVNSGTAVYATTSGTAVFANTSGTAVSISGDITKSQVSDFTSGTVASAGTAQQSGTAVFADTSGTATYATTSGTATFATNSGTAVFATNASTAVTISGSIAQSQVTNLVTDLAGKANLAGGNAFTGAQTVTGTAIGSNVLRILGASGQTANLQEWVNGGVVQAFVSPFGAAGFGTNTLLGRLTVNTGSTGSIGAVIRGVSGQTANLLELQTSAGTVVSRITANGALFVNNQTTAAESILIQRGGSTHLRVDPFNNMFATGTVTVGQDSTAGSIRLGVYAGSATTVGQIIRGAASQTANLQEWQNSAGGILARVSSGGALWATGVGTVNALTQLQELNSGGFVHIARATAAVTNPGANIGRIYFRDGTNAGTLKLVVRAGAAGAETTILDNIPQ